MSKKKRPPKLEVATPIAAFLKSHGLVAGQKVTFDATGRLPRWLKKKQIYYVVAPTKNTFSIKREAT